MNELSLPTRAKKPSADEMELVKKFLNDTTLFLGPDPEIMQNHDLMPRTADEDEAIEAFSQPHVIAKIRDRRRSELEGFLHGDLS